MGFLERHQMPSQAATRKASVKGLIGCPTLKAALILAATMGIEPRAGATYVLCTRPSKPKGPAVSWRLARFHISVGCISTG